MFAKDIMKKNCIVCTEEMSLMEIYQLMQDNDCDFITVVEDNAHKNPIGVVTEHDICLQVIGKGRNPRHLTVANVMNTEITKTFDTSTLAYCSDLLKTSQTTRLFIIDDDSKLCGTLTKSSVESNKNNRKIENLSRSGFLSEFGNSTINRIL